MEMEKKNLAIIILAVVLGVSGVGNIILGSLVAVPEPSVKNTIIAGDMYGPDNLDPHELWESAGFDIVMQIYEGLYRYDIGNIEEDQPLMPQLAAEIGTWDLDPVDPINGMANCTIPLRQDVWFHDGTKFNAAAVKWSFDRLAYWMNISGTLPATETVSQIESLYRWPDWTPVINRTEIVDEYTIKFVLNKPYGVFDAILTFNGAFIMSPAVTLFDTRFEVSQCVGPNGTGHRISGTGPFIFESYIAGVETRMKRWDRYYKGAAAVEKLVINIIQDADARNNAMLAGDINVLESPHPSFYDEMRDSPKVNLVEVDSPPSSITQYLGMNNKIINKTWRQAISWALDYDYMIDELLEGYAARLESPIPVGIAYSNYSSQEAYYDVTKARQVMQSMGFGVGFTTDAQWQGASFRTLNYTYNVGNKFREDMLILLQQNMDMIGVEVIDNGKEWTPYLDLVYNRTAPGYDGLSLWFIGWIPDYNDASNYVNSLMSNVSSGNAAQVNDHKLEMMLRAGIVETDPVERAKIYNEMQEYLCEDLMPWAWGYSSLNRDAFAPNVKGFPTNPWGYSYFYPCYITVEKF
ncbi:MAG: ABC transporter substrate-binding protein [Candidatus Hodarchaeota archaeon]